MSAPARANLLSTCCGVRAKRSHWSTENSIGQAGTTTPLYEKCYGSLLQVQNLAKFSANKCFSTWFTVQKCFCHMTVKKNLTSMVRKVTYAAFSMITVSSSVQCSKLTRRGNYGGRGGFWISLPVCGFGVIWAHRVPWQKFAGINRKLAKSNTLWRIPSGTGQCPCDAIYNTLNSHPPRNAMYPFWTHFFPTSCFLMLQRKSHPEVQTRLTVPRVKTKTMVFFLWQSSYYISAWPSVANLDRSLCTRDGGSIKCFFLAESLRVKKGIPRKTFPEQTTFLIHVSL